MADDALEPQTPLPRPHAFLRGVGERLRRHPVAVGLTLLVFAITVLNLVWLAKETRPPHFDMAGHLGTSLIYREYFVDFHPAFIILDYHYYPPVIYWVANLFYAGLGTAEWVAVLSNTVFLTVLVFSVYGIGNTLWSRRVGVVSALFAIGSPVIVTQFKEFQTDGPLTAMIALSLYLLVRCDAFSDRKHSVFLGIACGFGVLTKWTFALAIALPIAVGAIAMIKTSVDKRSVQPLFNAALAALAAYAIAVPWYSRNGQTLLTDFRAFTLNPEIYRQYADPAVFSREYAIRYAWWLVDHQLQLGLCILLVVGLVTSFLRFSALRTNVYPLALIAGVYVAFTLVRHKDPRYALPMVPAIAVVGSFWIDRLPVRVRTLAGAAIAAVAVFNFMTISFGNGPLPYEVRPTILEHPVSLYANRGYLIGPPSGENWHQEEIFSTMQRRSPTVRLWYRIPSTIWFNDAGMRYYGMRYGIRIVASQRDATFIAIRKIGAEARFRNFRLYARWRLPDATILTLYEKEPENALSTRD